MGELGDAAAGLRRAGADLAATLLDATGTRLELASVEFEQAQRRLVGLLCAAGLVTLWRRTRGAPRLLQASRAELARDARALRAGAHA